MSIDLSDDILMVSELLKKRLGLTDAQANEMAEQVLAGVVDQAVASIQSRSVAPTSIMTVRMQLVESIANRMKRLPTARELTAMLRIPESTARAVLRNVLAMSDRVTDVALRSIFERATESGSVGKGGSPSGGKKWELSSGGDLEVARNMLEARGVPFSTDTETDGSYVLVVDKSFDPKMI